jgi:hypothetical protein
MASPDDAQPPDGTPPRPWRPTGDELMSAIEKASAARRANCPAFVEEFAEMYAADSSPKELDRTWVRLVQEYPWYADDLLHCLDVTLRQDDGPLPPIISDIAQLHMEEGDVERAMSAEERKTLARQWLQELLERFRPVFEKLSTS